MNWQVYLDRFTALYAEYAVYLLAAALAGAIVGVERELTGKPAGLRTCMLVCVGAALFTIVSWEMSEMFGGDPTRVAAQIVTGVGFLGAGAIMRERGRGITGLTTAAAIWLAAAVGMLAGSGHVIGALAISVASVILIYSLSFVEVALHRSRAPMYIISIDEDHRHVEERVNTLLAIYRDVVHDQEPLDPQGRESARIGIRFTGSDNERHDFLHMIYDVDGVAIAEHEETRKKFKIQH